LVVTLEVTMGAILVDLEVTMEVLEETQDMGAILVDLEAIMEDLVVTQAVSLVAIMEDLVATQEVSLVAVMEVLVATQEVSSEAAVEVLVEAVVDMEEVVILPTADRDRTAILVTMLDLPVDSSILTTQDPVVDTQEVSVEERLKKTPMIVSSLVDRRLIYH